MNLLTRSATAVVAALALAVPAGAVTLSADAAPSKASAQSAHAVAKKAGLKLKRSAKYSHKGQKGVKLTAITSGKGKVKFSVNGKTKAKVKLKKGKASFRMSKKTSPGKYTVSAQFKGAKKSVKVRVYNSAISLSATSFTISKSTDTYDLPELTGSVKFKGKTAKGGYVDIYQDGKKKGGTSSPSYCCFDIVAKNGTFDFSAYSFLGEVQEKKVGTYKYQAFYTATPSYAEYIYSAPITVTVTP